MLELGLGIGLFRKRGPSVSEILAALGGADFTPLADYSNCWSDSLGTTQATRDSVVGKIASTVGSFVATQSTEGYKPILRDGFSYKPMVSGINNLGPELITNGTFDTDTGWTKGTGWTISGGTAVGTAAPVDAIIYQNISVTAGSTYLVKFDLARTSGGISPFITVTDFYSESTYAVSGTYYHAIKVASTGTLKLGFIRRITDFTGTIDNVSVKEVLQGTGETWTFTGTPIANRAGLQRQTDGTLALRCGGVTGNYASTPDSTATSITGDLTIVAMLKLANYASGVTQYIASKQTSSSSNVAFRWGISATGNVFLTVSPDGTSIPNGARISTIPLSIANNSTVWIKSIFIKDFDGVNNIVRHFYSLDGVAYTQLGTDLSMIGIAGIYDSTASIMLGDAASQNSPINGTIHYAAAYANDTGTGTPAWEFNPNRDGAVPSCPYLDFDGTNDWLETNIAPGSYDAGYLCGGWVQMEAVGSINAVFGSSASAAVHGVRLANSATNTLVATRFNGTVGTSSVTTGTSSAYSPCVLAAEFTPSNSKARINSLAQATDVSSSDYRGSTQVALLGSTNNTESGVSATNFMQGCMFSQIWLPSIPTDEQQAVLRAYCASKAGVTL